MKELIHIVGLNNEYKDDFISKIHIASPNYDIIDVDDLTQKITNDKKMAKLYDDYEKNKGDKNKAKQIGTDINTEWAKELQTRLNKTLSSNDKNTIIIGLTTSIINTGAQKIHISLPTNFKFIVDIDLVENAKHIIRNNLKDYKHEIINGKFPLEYINLDFLIKRREQLNQIYIKNLYIQKKGDDIIKFLKEHVPNIDKNLGKMKKLYYASNQEYVKTISSKNLILYDNEVSAILSLFKFAEINYDPTNRTIKELTKNAFRELEKDCFIYEIIDLEDVFFNGDNYKNNKRLKINKNTHIDNVYEVFQKFGLKSIKYK